MYIDANTALLISLVRENVCAQQIPAEWARRRVSWLSTNSKLFVSLLRNGSSESEWRESGLGHPKGKEHLLLPLTQAQGSPQAKGSNCYRMV